MPRPVKIPCFRLGVFCCWALGLAIAPITVSAQNRDARNPLAADFPQPEFVLVGTSRIGDRLSAILRHRKGDLIVVRDFDLAAPIAGYSRYSVVKIGSGRISLQYPSDEPCFEYRDLGVSCEGVAMAALELAVGVMDRFDIPAIPLSTVPVATVIEGIPAEPGSLIDALQAEAQERGQTPIVPPGMEMIETPSGYRLVPAD
ncbi:MAG: hypothetical protein RLZZ385_1196 [Pseudomonadota bacterium]